MASPVSASLLLAVLALFSAAASARPGSPFHPCGTLFITYTISTSSSSSSAAASNDSAAVPHRSFRFVSIYRTIIPFSTSSSSSSYGFEHRRPLLIRRPDSPRREAAGLGFSSLQERAKDILVVVIGLLFGVGCGALTAALMYLVWSIVSIHYEVSGSDGEVDDYLDDSPKKAGYTKIPAAESTPAKEGMGKIRVWGFVDLGRE